MKKKLRKVAQAITLGLAALPLAAAVIAIREGLDVSTWRALASTAVGWAAWLLLSVGAHALVGTAVNPLWPF